VELITSMRSEWISYREEIQKSIKLEKSKEIEEILSMQPLLDSLVVANSDSIKLLKNGILNLKTPTNKKFNVVHDYIEALNV